MAIAIDTTGKSTNGTGTTHNFAYTATGLNIGMVVSIEVDAGSNTCTGVNWNTSEAMTQVDSVNVYDVVFMSTWVLIGATATSANVTATFSSAGPNHTITVGTYTGTDSGGSTGGSDSHATTTFSGAAADKTLSTTTIADNAWIVALVRADSGSWGVGTNVTSRQTGGTNFIFGDTNGPITPAGATNQTFTNSTGNPTGGILSVGLKPLVAVGGVQRLPYLTTLGVGQ